jgi:uncharacterized protein (TIGR00288 family)
MIRISIFSRLFSKTDKRQNVGVFIDAENFTYGDVKGVLDIAKEYGRPLIKRSYANWAAMAGSKVHKYTSQCGFKAMHHSPSPNSKNMTDMHMSIDMIECLYTKDIDCFVIVTGDADFTPALIKISEAGKKIVLIRHKNMATCEYLENYCDEVRVIASPAQNVAAINAMIPMLLSQFTKEEVINSTIKFCNEFKNYHGFVNSAKLSNKLAGMYGPKFYVKIGFFTFKAFVESMPDKFTCTTKPGTTEYFVIMKQPLLLSN